MQRLEKLFFYSIILFLPTQLGKHFWPDFSFIEGIRIDYLSPTIYLTDILILFLMITIALNKLPRFGVKISNFQFPISNQFQNEKFKMQNYLLVTLVVLVLISSILFSSSPMAGFYKLLKIFEFGFFGFYIATNVSWKKDFQTILLFFAIGILFESTLTIAQFFKQSSIGGMFWFFGERTFSGQTPGIANAIIDGRLILRPYGTFPHPNVLAGYFVIVMTMIVLSIKYQVLCIKKMLFGGSVIVGTMALFLTLSRVAIVLWFVVLGLWLIAYLRRRWQMTNGKWKIVLLVVLVFIGSIGIIHFTPLSSRFASLLDVDKETVVRRQELNYSAIEMFKSSPLFGVGLNNFLVRLPEFSAKGGSASGGQKPIHSAGSGQAGGPLWLQPVHNIYLLILAETGVAGLLILSWLVLKTFKKLKQTDELRITSYKLQILLLVLFLGMFDHYFLTLQQGQLLLAFAFGLVFAKGR